MLSWEEINNMKNTIIVAKDIRKSFIDGLVTTEVLKGITFEVQEGEFVAIMGRSGAGKSTLLYQLSLLDSPSSGSIVLDGNVIDRFTNSEKTAFRLRMLGYVFQDYSLLPELTAEENIMVPLLMQGISRDISQKRAQEVLKSVDLEHRKGNIPAELSGGEQQRVSIARAIVHNPKILFADEPTANLDSLSSKTVMEIFKKLNKDNGITIVMVTHELEYGRLADRIINLSDGMIVK
jgi:putative ABC transport system ATP-binding protein